MGKAKPKQTVPTACSSWLPRCLWRVSLSKSLDWIYSSFILVCLFFFFLKKSIFSLHPLSSQPPFIPPIHHHNFKFIVQRQEFPIGWKHLLFKSQWCRKTRCDFVSNLSEPICEVSAIWSHTWSKPSGQTNEIKLYAILLANKQTNERTQPFKIQVDHRNQM